MKSFALKFGQIILISKKIRKTIGFKLFQNIISKISVNLQKIPMLPKRFKTQGFLSQTSMHPITTRNKFFKNLKIFGATIPKDYRFSLTKVSRMLAHINLYKFDFIYCFNFAVNFIYFLLYYECELTEEKNKEL